MMNANDCRFVALLPKRLRLRELHYPIQGNVTVINLAAMDDSHFYEPEPAPSPHE